MISLPALDPTQLAALRADIEKRGVLVPIMFNTRTNNLIDGHNRQSIANELGIEAPRMEVDVDPAEEEQMALTLNLLRRHLSPQDRKAAFAKLASLGLTQQKIAEATGVSQQTVSLDLRGVTNVGNPEIEPALDKQGRPPEKRGGRPRKEQPAPVPVAAPPVVAPPIEYVDEYSKELAEAEVLEQARHAASAARYEPLMKALREAKALASDCVKDHIIPDLDAKQAQRLRDLARTTAKVIARLEVTNLGSFFGGTH